MKAIKYTITFHTYWQCGSGLAAGADVDTLCIKDCNGMPFIPGKTIKGLVREAADEILTIAHKEYNIEDYLKVFGYYADNEKDNNKRNQEMKKSESFFTNAKLCDYEAICQSNLQRFLFSAVTNTAIDENGVAKKHRLRKIEVAVPCTLVGEITDVPDSMVTTLLEALKFIKNMGTSRNRGLGRCTIEGKEVEL